MVFQPRFLHEMHRRASHVDVNTPGAMDMNPSGCSRRSSPLLSFSPMRAMPEQVVDGYREIVVRG